MAIEKLGPYRVNKMLGRGGMGTVYAARNMETGELVAVKVLAASIAQEEHFRQRFEAEIQSLIKLDHPNIVHILAFDVDGEHMYYAMELVEGRSLFDEQKSGRRFNWREVAKIGIDTCAALRHAHDRGILHRDLKPGNLLLDSEGRIKLTDFGIAKLFGGRQLTADGGVIGTVDFMSPEQAKGEPTSQRSDLYSLGSVLFALLARRPPFAAKTIPAALHSLSVDAPPLVRDFAPETPAELERIIDKLLAKDPAMRIGSAQSVANRLQAVLDEASENEAVDSDDREFELSDEPDLPQSDAVSKADQPTTAQPSIGRLNLSPEAQPTRRAPTLADTPRGQPTAAKSDDVAKRGFTEVNDEVRKREDNVGRRTESRQPVWPLLLALIVVVALAALGLVYANRPPSADDLYETIQAVAEDEDADKVLTVEEECREFLDQFPEDARAAEVRHTLDRIELLRYPRRLQRKRQFQGLSALSPAEQFYLQSLEQLDGDPDRAFEGFSGIALLFGDDPDEADCVRAAEMQVARLEPVLGELHREHLALLDQQLELAKRLRESDSPAAEKLLRGIIQLYGDKRWADEQVQQARRLLAGQPSP